MRSSTRLPRLSPGELANAWLDEPGIPFQIGLVGVFDAAPFTGRDGRLDTGRVRLALAWRARRVPALSRRIVWTRLGEGRPVWVEDPAFDPRHHVECATLPDGADFASWAADRLVRPLDLRRPPWRAEVVDGLPGSRFGLLVVLHHVVADGLAGVAIAGSLLDDAPDVDPAEPPTRAAAPLPGRRVLVADNVRARAAALAGAVRRLPAVPGRVRHGWRQAGDAAVDFRTTAPTTSLSRPVGPGRRLAIVEQPLGELRATAHTLGATVNDVLLTAVTSGLRALLLARGDAIDGVTLRASPPVGSRDAGQRGRILVVGLPVGAPEPLHRLAAIMRATATAKDRLHAGGGNVLDVLHLPDPAARAAVRWMRSIAGRRINLFVTNVPGPLAPLWLAGARMLRAVPVAPLVRGVPLGVTALSYAGTLHVSVNADAAVRDVGVLADGMRQAFSTLRDAARTGARPPAAADTTTIRDAPGAIENAIEIARSPDVVFAYCTDPRHEPEWNPQLTEVEKLTEGPVGAGSRFRMRFRRGVGDSTVENVRFDPPRSWAATSTSRRLDVRFEGRVDPTGPGSRLVVRTVLSPRGMLRPLRPVLRPFMRREWEHHLAAIKDRLEPGTSG